MVKKSDFSKEIEALGVVLKALGNLDDEQQAFVYRTVGERLKIVLPARKRKDSGGYRDARSLEDKEESDDSHEDEESEITPKEFMRRKNARTDVERIACLAFYLTHHRDTAIFKTIEVTALNTEAAQQKMSNPSQALLNATNQNHYIAAAGKKGEKQITTLGEDVVRALPNHESVTALLASNKKPKRRKRRTTKKKAGATPKRPATRKK